MIPDMFKHSWRKYVVTLKFLVLHFLAAFYVVIGFNTIQDNYVFMQEVTIFFLTPFHIPLYIMGQLSSFVKFDVVAAVLGAIVFIAFTIGYAYVLSCCTVKLRSLIKNKYDLEEKSKVVGWVFRHMFLVLVLVFIVLIAAFMLNPPLMDYPIPL